MKALSTQYVSFLTRLDETRPSLLIVAVARTCLALGSLITLAFSGPAILFDEKSYDYTNFNQAFDYVNLFYYFGFAHITYYYAVCIALLVLVLSGYYPRVTGVLHWLVAFSIFRSATMLEGGDQLTMILTFLLIPLTLCDSRRNHWSSTPSRTTHYFVANVSWQLMRLQIALLYYQSGVEKIYKLDEWKNGTAIYYFFSDPVFGYSDWLGSWFHGLLLNSYIVSTLTWGTMLFEVLLFGAYFMRRRRRARLLGAALLFHFSIALVLGLVSFFFAMAGGLVLYLSSRRTERLVRRGLAWLSQPRRRSLVEATPPLPLPERAAHG